MKPLLYVGLLSCSISYAQTLSVPDAQGVYGGSVLHMAQADDGVNFSRLYFATESANSIFYADVQHIGSRPVFDSVTPLPSADWDNGYGSNVNQVQAYSTTGQVFFLSMGNIYSADPTSSSASLVMSMAKNFLIEGNVLIAVLNGAQPTSNDSLVFGSLDLMGNFTASGGFDLTRKFNGSPQMVVDITTNYLHLFEAGATPYQLRIAENINSMTSSPTITSAVNPAPVLPNIEWMTFGISPDGKWYVAGGPSFGAPPSTDRKVAYSADNGMTWTTSDFNLPGPPGGVPGPNFQFTAVGALQYAVYCGRAYSDSIGAPGTWREIGHAFTGDNNKANDGFVLMDYRNQSTAYITTNVGLGFSRYDADSVYGANEGLTAVQVNDIDMTPSFATGWVASKSGIRKVEAYKSGAPSWSLPMFPNGDGSPYYTVAIDPSDSNTVYAGNGRVYKTTNSGASWNLIFDPMMGGMHGSYNYPRVGTRVTGISVSPKNSDRIMVTYSLDQTDNGGVFYSDDGGSNWAQFPLLGGWPGQDVDINDIVAVENAFDVTYYLALDSDPTTAGYYGLFTVRDTAGGTRRIGQDSNFGPTDALLDLELTKGGDTLLALYHTSSTINPPYRIYMLDLSTQTWSYVVGRNGVTPSAIAAGDGQLFMAQANEIYIHPIDSILAPWTLGYSYPVGTRIETLFYDELLVGTGTGLYAHDFNNNISIVEETPLSYRIYPNPSDGYIHWDIVDDVCLFNASGQEVLQLQGVNEMNLQSLAAGIYFLKGNTIGVHKIIVH